MHTVEDINGRGVYLIAVGCNLIKVDVLHHPVHRGYIYYTDVSRSIPGDDTVAVADYLRRIAERMAWLSKRGAAEEVMGTSV
ncbi:MAG: hypothetical protein KF770_17635 [Anaerolineae bacterium]|nr:hypothetical protein [Anaerolineae bacterium]